MNATRFFFVGIVILLQSAVLIGQYPITGSGTGSTDEGYIPRFNSGTNIINSNLYQWYPHVGLGTTTPNVLGAGGTSVTLTIMSGTSSSGIGLLEYGTSKTLYDGAEIGTLAAVGTTNNSGRKELTKIMTFAAGSTAGDRGGHLTFWTKPDGGLRTERMRLTSSGNMGIGTTGPVNKLDVEGGMVVGAGYSGTNTAPGNGLLVQGNVGIATTAPSSPLDVEGQITGNSLLLDPGTNPTTWIARFYGRNSAASVPVLWVSQLTSATSYDTRAIQGNNAGAASNGATAYGVLGTSLGAATSGTNVGGAFSADNNGTNTGVWIGAYNTPGYTSATITGARIDITADPSNTAKALYITGPNAGTNKHAIYSSATAASYFAGGIGIGSQLCSGDMLTVNGQVHASSFLTNSSFCDFVFEDNYNLMSLDDVEKYIKAEKHLPGIPPAREIEEKGLDIGDMQVKMMQKIEELTLYVIDLKKQNDGLKLRLASVEGQ